MNEPKQGVHRALPAPTYSLPRSKPLGQLLITLGILDPSQLASVLQVQKQQTADRRQPLGRICVERGLLSKERLDLILDGWGKRLRIGELLVNRGKVTPSQLDMALEERRRKGGKLGEALLELGYLDEFTLTEALAEQYDLPYVPLTDLHLNPELARYVNPQFAWRHGVVPVGRIGRRLTVAIHDPTRTDLIRDLERSTGLHIQPVLATPQEVHSLARRLYEFAGDGADETGRDGVPSNAAGSETVGLLANVVQRAASFGASEILLEPAPDGGRIRMRAGGAMRELHGIEKQRGCPSELARFAKGLALLDPADRRRPQEGFLGVAVGDTRGPSSVVRMRIRTQPGAHGESASLKLFGDAESSPSLDEVGLSDFIRDRFSALVKDARGVILIVGPAGSGKRSTLRGVLDLLNRSSRRIFSAEEMILYKYGHAEQWVVIPGSRNDYASLLGRFLGQDPGAIVLDRIVDGETATQIFSVRNGGPLIVAGLQAGNTMSALQKLLTFGVDSRALAASLSGVLTQRLARGICPHCAHTYEPRRSVLDEWFRCEPPFSAWRRGSGCEGCSGTGFSGRIVVSELWIPSAEERECIDRAEDASSLREVILQSGWRIGQDALAQAVEGRTTLEEALKTVPYEDVVHTRLHGLERDKVVAGGSNQAA